LKHALSRVKPSHGSSNHGWIEPSSSITRAIYEPLRNAEHHPAPPVEPVSQAPEAVAADENETHRNAGAA
jgi:hypothetical protein